MKRNIIEFITNMSIIASLTYWINSILIKGFHTEPINILVGVMIVIVFVFLKNLTIDSFEDLDFQLFKKDQPIENYYAFMFLLIVIDLMFVVINLVLP